jgi:hypothetical protein
MGTYPHRFYLSRLSCLRYADLMKKVYSARDEVDAHLVKGILAQNGIEAVVQAEGLSGILGTVQSSAEASPSLWVSDEDETRAAAALVSVRDGAAPEAAGATPWKCPNCGEEIEPQFTECWNCGATRPGAV